MPWQLSFPFATVDDRVAAREHVSILRRDPAVISIRPTYVQGQPFVIFAEFLEGHDEPATPEVAERLRPFLTHLPARDEVMSTGRRSGGTIRGVIESLRQRLNPPNLDTPEGRDRLIQQAIMSQEGRSRLATAMAMPLRRNIDYQGVARRTFLVDQLPEGALPNFTVEPSEPPEWAVPGAWAECRIGGHDFKQGEVFRIKEIVRSDSGGANYVRLEVDGRNPDIETSIFAASWIPGTEPVEPLDVWERLLGEDLI